MHFPEREGFFCIYSYDTSDRLIYKLTRSDNLRRSLETLPPNWFLLLCYPCDDSVIWEKLISRSFRIDEKTGYSRAEDENMFYLLHRITSAFEQALPIFDNYERRDDPY